MVPIFICAVKGCGNVATIGRRCESCYTDIRGHELWLRHQEERQTRKLIKVHVACWKFAKPDWGCYGGGIGLILAVVVILLLLHVR